MARSKAIVLSCVVACATLPTTSDDAGTSDAANDGLIDATDDIAAETSQADASVDVVGDATLDSDVSDVALIPPDAPYVDLDAATAPWALGLPSTQLFSASVDTNANVIVGGMTHPYDYAFYVASLDGGGGTRWTHQNAGNQFDYAYNAFAVLYDSSGNAYATGYLTSAVDLGGGAIGPGTFVVKYDANGIYQWVYGAFANSSFRSIVQKSTGNLVIAGFMGGSENYGGGSVVSNGGQDAIVVEITPQKQFVSAKRFGGTGDQLITSMAIDWADRLLFTGPFEGSLDFGGGAMTGPPPGQSVHDVYVAKLDGSGNYIAQRDCKSKGSNTYLNGIATDWQGNVFVTGALYENEGLDFGGGNLVSSGSHDVVVAKLDGSLGHVWSARYGDTYSQQAYAVVADPTGGVVVAGGYESNLDFGLGNLPTMSTQNYNPFVARFDASGNIASDKAFGPTNVATGEVMGLAFVTWPDVVAVGSCSGSLVFPSNTVSCNTGAFAARFQP